jgi:PKD repeat protein
LQQYVFNRVGGQFQLPAFAQSPTAAPGGQPGGILSLSASGTNAGSAIVWAVHQLNGDANQQVLPGILHAYDARNVAVELWNSEQNSARDRVGNFAKFVPPTVANGKVYLATFSGRLDVYGLLPTAQLAVAPATLDFGLVTAGSNALANFVVTNQGGAVLSNGVASIGTGPFTLLAGTPFGLPAFGATNLVVRFAPTGAGHFTNTVVFTTANGGNSTNTVIGTGALIPAAGFTANPTAGTWPLVVSFTDSSTGTITNSFWSFGDGASTNTLPGNVTHTYVALGTNTVLLTVTGPVGTNTLTRSNYIVVTNPAPVTLTVQFTTNQVRLTWPEGTLQLATNVLGPYTNLTGVASPYTFPPTGTASFFRVKVR